ncbi:GNAT family N-acetyltransferase [Microbacterium elymi]|uniref:GNAT family N-acetyltransferase n=1 Tax=Microbacterium elymi TaxID=2909587 RepID=A0ABY5NIC5_9MICO|nr:GNAT family N-acetyltransferase [Microbacterium elymi]UUT34933.1 GNAT family N-acetyltransferase [Microbacterium elymi]
MVLTVRRATEADARAIATIRVASWRVAYHGLIADALLDRLDVDREAHLRALHWDRHNADPRSASLLAERDGYPVGWAATGLCRDEDAAGRGELYALYALPENWSTGVGHALMMAAEAALRASGFHTASLWVLDGNERAASFYERHGWREDGAAKEDDRIVGDTGIPALHERRRVRDLGEVVPR